MPVLVSFLFFSQYTRHKSFVGGQIDASVLEMWEESVDGSGKGIMCFVASLLVRTQFTVNVTLAVPCPIQPSNF